LIHAKLLSQSLQVIPRIPAADLLPTDVASNII
jgi:hypothetical protein